MKWWGSIIMLILLSVGLLVGCAPKEDKPPATDLPPDETPVEPPTPDEIETPPTVPTPETPTP